MEIIKNFSNDNNEGLYITTIFCKNEENIKFSLQIYMNKRDNNNDNNSKESEFQEKKRVLKSNLNILYNLTKMYPIADFEDIICFNKINIIRKFINSNFFLYMKCVNSRYISDFTIINNIEQENIIKLIPYTNNELYWLNIPITLYKQNEPCSYEDTSKYIILGKNEVTSSLKYDNCSGYSLLNAIINKLICLEDMLNIINKTYINVDNICYECKKIEKFCSECENKTNIIEIIVRRKILHKLTFVSPNLAEYFINNLYQ